MACPPCWQQRQVFVSAMRQGDAYLMAQAAMRGVHIATDKYIRGIDVTRKYAVPFTRSTVPVWRRRPSA